MATKTYNWNGDSELVFTIHDGPAKGRYKISCPNVKDHIEGDMIIMGHIHLPTKRQRLLAKLSDFPGLLNEIEANERARVERWRAEEAARVHHCERCATGIQGAEIVWNSERVRGIKVAAPYCQPCARLLRIAAGGIGVAGEPLTSRADDNTPYTKGDF